MSLLFVFTARPAFAQSEDQADGFGDWEPSSTADSPFAACEALLKDLAAQAVAPKLPELATGRLREGDEIRLFIRDGFAGRPRVLRGMLTHVDESTGTFSFIDHQTGTIRSYLANDPKIVWQSTRVIPRFPAELWQDHPPSAKFRHVREGDWVLVTIKDLIYRARVNRIQRNKLWLSLPAAAPGKFQTENPLKVDWNEVADPQSDALFAHDPSGNDGFDPRRVGQTERNQRQVRVAEKSATGALTLFEGPLAEIVGSNAQKLTISSQQGALPFLIERLAWEHTFVFPSASLAQ